MGDVAAVVVAAGRGTRFRAGPRKQYVVLCGRPVLAHVMEVMARSGVVDRVVLVVPAGEEEHCRELFGGPKVCAVVAGGDRRLDSVFHGLVALAPPPEIVVVHDGVRPLVREEHLAEVVRVAREAGAATLAVPVKDTIKVVDPSGCVVRTLPREELWQVQTPQAFRYEVLLAAHRLARRDGCDATDDAALVERTGQVVRVVRGDYSNIKITTEEDLLLAEMLFRRGAGCSGP